MTTSGARWRGLFVVLAVWLPVLGCAGDRSPSPEGPPPPAAPIRAAPSPVVPAATKGAGIGVTILSDGSSVIGQRITDVAMLRRQPDGTYERTCGPPDPETRTMMEGMMRARRGNR